jgi:hypothetical protein
MFCKNCGHQSDNGKKFCSQCGTELTAPIQTHVNTSIEEEVWWKRLIKVVYIVLHIPLPLILIVVWAGTSSSYDYYSKTTHNNYGEAFFYVLLSLIIYVLILRLIKLAYRYVVLGKHPEFKKEFKRFY